MLPISPISRQPHPGQETSRCPRTTVAQFPADVVRRLINVALLLAIAIFSGTRLEAKDPLLQPSVPPIVASRPNVILLMADDLGAGDLSAVLREMQTDEGHPHPDREWLSTPHLDALASRGIRLTRFYAASPVCSPTRASCLTGQHPHRFGITHANRGHLPHDALTLSSLLDSAGYRCGHFGKWHLGTLTTRQRDSNRGKPGNARDYSAPWHHNFHECFSTEAKVPTRYPYRVPRNNADLPVGFGDPNFYGTRYWRMPDSDELSPRQGRAVPCADIHAGPADDSMLITQQALSFIEHCQQDSTPFLAVIWYHAPHKPTVSSDKAMRRTRREP